MKFLSLFFAMLFFSFTAFAQAEGRITGIVTGTDGNPMKGATVQLSKEPKAAALKTTATDQSGSFSLTELLAGKYKLVITAVGYANKNISTEIPLANTAVTIPAVQMVSQSGSLASVTVAATKQAVEQKIDRMVVNVDAMVSNAGATALEVLEKSPGVTVDNDGNISLKGKQGVIIMMDGKPTYLSAADLANVLRNLPASALDKIEIMTNPSSKYDAAGNSGIIDIRTKKSKTKGSNGSIAIGNTTSLFKTNGKDELLYKPNISVNYNYKKNKINFFANAVYNNRESKSRLDVESRYYRDGQRIDSTNKFVSYFRGRNNNYTLKTGVDFTPDKKNTFGIVLNGFKFRGHPAIQHTLLTPTSQAFLFPS